MDELTAGVLQIDIVRHISAGVNVYEILATLRRRDVVGAVLLGELGHLAALDVHHVAMALERTDFGRTIVDVLAILGEAFEISDDKLALGELTDFVLADGVEIEVVETIALGLPDELVGVVGQEVGGALGFHPLLVTILKDCLDEVTCDGAVFVELQVVLFAVQNADVDAFVVGVPGDGGEVLFHRLTGLDGQVLASLHVVDMQGDLMACHAGHGVFDRLGGGDALGDVDQRIVGHHALIHGIVSQL